MLALLFRSLARVRYPFWKWKLLLAGKPRAQNRWVGRNGLSACTPRGSTNNRDIRMTFGEIDIDKEYPNIIRGNKHRRTCEVLRNAPHEQ